MATLKPTDATYCIAYDISNTKLRTRLAKKLKQKGCTRIQKSLFIIYRCADKELAKIKTALLALLKDKTIDSDSVVCLPLGAQLLPPPFWIGNNTAAQPQEDIGRQENFF